MARTKRTAARVLPVSPAGRVLLVQEQDPVERRLSWGTFGGAVDAGETLTQAAVRELFEEAGVRVAAEQLVGPIHRTSYEHSWGGVDYVSDALFFAVSLGEDTEVSFAHLMPEEVGNVTATCWWTPDDLEREGGAVVAWIPTLMRQAVTAVHP